MRELVMLDEYPIVNKYMGNVNRHCNVFVKDDLLWSSPNKKLIYIDKSTENSIKVTSEIQKVDFISSTPYKIGKKSDKKLILLT